MLNDSDLQAKRVLIWQELLIEMPPEHRRLIEEKPSGEIFQTYCGVVAQRLADWNQKRKHEKE